MVGYICIRHEYRGTLGNAAWAGQAMPNMEMQYISDGTDDGLSLEIDELELPASLVFPRLRRSDNSGTAIDTNHQIKNILLSQSSNGSNDNLEIGTEGNQVEIYMDSVVVQRMTSRDCQASKTMFGNTYPQRCGQ